MIPFNDPYEWQESFGRFLLNIKTGGYFVFDQQPTNGLHLHDYYELCLVTTGTGTYTYAGNAVPLSAGDVLLAKPQDLHEISSFDSRDLELIFFSFDIVGGPILDACEDKEQLIRAIQNTSKVRSCGHRRLLGYLQVLGRELSQNWVLRQGLSTFFAEMLATLIPAEQEPGQEFFQQSIVYRAIDRIDQNIRMPLTVPGLARMVGISDRSLRRYFTRVLNKTVVEVIRERKLNRGSALLLMNFDVGSVADMLSMDLSHFSREFRKQFGVCPSQYQEAYSIRSRSSSRKLTIHRVR